MTSSCVGTTLLVPCIISRNFNSLNSYVPGRHTSNLKSMFSLMFPWHTSGATLPDTNKVVPTHDDVIKWNYFPRYWPFVRGIHHIRSFLGFATDPPCGIFWEVDELLAPHFKVYVSTRQLERKLHTAEKNSLLIFLPFCLHTLPTLCLSFSSQMILLWNFILHWLLCTVNLKIMIAEETRGTF